MLSALVICLLLGTAAAVRESRQKWDYVTVRDGAHMFWWLYYTTADIKNVTERPLIIWLQGGPGASSTGFGNFAEIGSLDVDLQPRNSTWVQYANVLFVDNPVGCGFSYVDNISGFAKNNSQIAADFIELLKQFYVAVPEFRLVPLYIFGESYGGKMTAEIALAVHKANIKGVIDVNLKGIGLGDSWISPIDSVMTWAPYLLNLGIVDHEGYKKILDSANKVKRAIDEKNYELATDLWFAAEMQITSVTNQVDFYNVLTKKKPYRISKLLDIIFNLGIDPDLNIKLPALMNNKIRQMLNVTTTWQYQNLLVFNALYTDFLLPVTSIVEEILNTTDILVTVYNGQLDLIVDTPGTLKWIENLNFKNKSQWKSSRREGFVSEGYYEGYVKKSGNLAFYWIDRSGHYVPVDNPAAMVHILREVTNNFTV